ncbi:ROK family protein [Enterococcus sp. LJL99]
MINKLIGIDIGGTAIKLAIFEENGKLIKKWQISTNITDDGRHITDEIITNIHSNLEKNKISKSEITGIGVGVPGPVNEKSVIRAVNLGWSNYPLKELLEQGIGVPVTLINDANAAALGEFWQGTSQQLQSIVFVTLGTGVGGGVIVNGKILNGQNSSGGEIGHIPVKSEEIRICGCKNQNCLECYGSANGLVQTMNLISGSEIVKSAKEVFILSEEGNVFAKAALASTIDHLARVIAGIFNTIDPEELVIGGGLSEAGQVFLEPLQKAIDQYVFPQIRGNIQIRKASLGNDAGAYGAAYQIKQRLTERQS